MDIAHSLLKFSIIYSSKFAYHCQHDHDFRVQTKSFVILEKKNKFKWQDNIIINLNSILLSVFCKYIILWIISLFMQTAVYHKLIFVKNDYMHNSLSENAKSTHNSGRKVWTSNASYKKQQNWPCKRLMQHIKLRLKRKEINKRELLKYRLLDLRPGMTCVPKRVWWFLIVGHVL